MFINSHGQLISIPTQQHHQQQQQPQIIINAPAYQQPQQQQQPIFIQPPLSSPLNGSTTPASSVMSSILSPREASMLMVGTPEVPTPEPSKEPLLDIPQQQQQQQQQQQFRQVFRDMPTFETPLPPTEVPQITINVTSSDLQVASNDLQVTSNDLQVTSQPQLESQSGENAMEMKTSEANLITVTSNLTKSTSEVTSSCDQQANLTSEVASLPKDKISFAIPTEEPDKLTFYSDEDKAVVKVDILSRAILDEIPDLMISPNQQPLTTTASTDEETPPSHLSPIVQGADGQGKGGAAAVVAVAQEDVVVEGEIDLSAKTASDRKMQEKSSDEETFSSECEPNEDVSVTKSIENEQVQEISIRKEEISPLKEEISSENVDSLVTKSIETVQNQQITQCEEEISTKNEEILLTSCSKEDKNSSKAKISIEGDQNLSSESKNGPSEGQKSKSEVLIAEKSVEISTKSEENVQSSSENIIIEKKSEEGPKKKNPPFICPNCDKSFKFEKFFQVHRKSC